MTAYQFSLVFLAALALSTALRIWLDLRHLRHVVAHRDRVPADFFVASTSSTIARRPTTPRPRCASA
jgi:hypothetical protein